MRLRLAVSLWLPVALTAAGCASGKTARAPAPPAVPSTPGLELLTPEAVFAAAPPPEWREPRPEDPSRASIDVACGVSPALAQGVVYAAVKVSGHPPRSAIAPLNVSLVLDRSGSMDGEPFANMLRAAQLAVGQFRDGDRVSVIVFSDGVYEAVPPVVLDPASRAGVLAAIRSLQNDGRTNISGGLLAGLRDVLEFWAEWQVNQVVLLSDGLPNRGITGTQQLADLAAQSAERGVGITAIGFGPEHDELLMQAIADAGGGTYHYVETAQQIPLLFQREATHLLGVAARDTILQVAVPPAFAVEDVIGHDYFADARGLWVRLGAVPHEEERYVVLRLRPRGPLPAALPVTVSYSDMARRAKFGVACRPALAGTGGRDAWVLELAGRAEAYWGLSEALGWADAGRDLYVIAQLGHTRDLLAGMRAHLGPGALAEEDRMLADAQTRLKVNVASNAVNASRRGGLGSLVDYGANLLVNSATAAADPSFTPAVRVAVQASWYGRPAAFYSARSSRAFKLHDQAKSKRNKQLRFDAYRQTRARPAPARSTAPRPAPAARR